MFRCQQIIIREYVCTSLKLLDYLKNTEFKLLKIIPGAVAAKLNEFKIFIYVSNKIKLS